MPKICLRSSAHPAIPGHWSPVTGHAFGLRIARSTQRRTEMTSPRLCLLVAGFPILLAAGSSAALAEYPERPIRIVVPFTAGGGTDIMARALGQHLSGAWGQNV